VPTAVTSLVGDGARMWVGFADGSIAPVVLGTGVLGQKVQLAALNGNPVDLAAFDGTRLWLASTGSTSLVVFDPARSQVVATVALAAAPAALGWDGVMGFVDGGAGTGQIVRIDPSTGYSTTTSAAGCPTVHAFAARRPGMFYGCAGKVGTIDDAGLITQIVPVNAGAVDLLVNDGGWLYAVDRGSGEVVVLDARTPAGPSSLFFVPGGSIASLAYDGHDLWATNVGVNNTTLWRGAAGGSNMPMTYVLPADGATRVLAFDGAAVWVAVDGRLLRFVA
jgi:hypothetical protein